MKFGSHVSIREGYLGAAKTAFGMEARAFQYFPKNPRNLGVKEFNQQDAEACKNFCLKNQLVSIAHTPYPTNLCAEDSHLQEVTKSSILNDLAIANACGSIGVVVHFGQYKGKEEDPLYGYQIMILMLNEILREWKGDALLLLENNAGQGNRMGVTLEEATQVRSLTQYPEKIGFCLDTCHLFASGVWTGQNWEEVWQKGEALDYFSHVRAVHLNDSMYPAASFRDRHASIGNGMIGEEGLRTFLRSSFLENIPIVLETPNVEPFTHQKELRLLSEWVAR